MQQILSLYKRRVHATKLPGATTLERGKVSNYYISIPAVNNLSLRLHLISDDKNIHINTNQIFVQQNHCDLPSKSRCKSKANLRLSEEENNAIAKLEDKPIVGCYFTDWAFYR